MSNLQTTELLSDPPPSQKWNKSHHAPSKPQKKKMTSCQEKEKAQEQDNTKLAVAQAKQEEAAAQQEEAAAQWEEAAACHEEIALQREIQKKQVKKQKEEEKQHREEEKQCKEEEKRCKEEQEAEDISASLSMLSYKFLTYH
jgi:hypothetical protein